MKKSLSPLPKQLEYLAESVKILHKLTKKIFAAKIESFV